MKRILYLLMASVLLAGALASGAAAQSLGDLAREARKNKRPSPTTKVYTNDDLPATASISVTAPAPRATAGGNEQETKEAEKSPEEKKKLEEEWRAKFKEQKDKIAVLQRELDALKGEYSVWSYKYNADVGNQLRNPQVFAEQDKKYRDQTDAKQKELQDAKDKLEKMREDVRKAGVPSSVGD